MGALGIPVRDTFSLIHNFDDYYTNGTYDGPRRLELVWSAAATGASTSAKKVYKIPPWNSIAYDCFKITIPQRYLAQGRVDPAIHELVHFLQHQTLEEEKNYFMVSAFSDPRYEKYLAQRCETEAHLVQLAFIIQHQIEYARSRLNEHQYKEVSERVAQIGSNGGTAPDRLPLLLHCKRLGLL